MENNSQTEKTTLINKIFGSLNITWPRLIIWAVIAGVYTGIMALLPAAKDTSFADISITFEWWILFGILIIVNSKKALESALKCFVFFLISQPLVYLVQVPFASLGWGLFIYYKPWFIWTLLTLPMGFIGYYMRREKWWSMLILAPMLVFLGIHYMNFLREAISFFPQHLLSTLFCVATLIIYPLFIFRNRKLRTAGLVISIVILMAGAVFALSTDRSYYNTTLMTSGGSLNVEFDDTYTAYLEDDSYGDVHIVYEENISDYMINAEFAKSGNTNLILEAPDGSRRIFAVTINRSSYEIEEIT